MSSELIGVGSIVVLLILLYIRVPIAIGLTAVSFGGIALLTNVKVAFSLLQTIPYTFVGTWTLSSVPMFLFMGYICYHVGITTGLFRAAKVIVNPLPGGLAIAAVFGCSGFAAVTGSSIACAAAVGRIAMPEMLKAKYDPGLSAGTLAASGTIGALIPPSILMILYGAIAQVSIIKLFLGGLVLGLITAAAYILVISVRVWLKPSLAPRLVIEEDYSTRDFVRDLWPSTLLIVGVFVGLFGGFFTPTEAGAAGSAMALLIAILLRALTIKTVYDSLVETLLTTSSIMIITVGANLFTRLMALSGVGDSINTIVVHWHLVGPMLMFAIAVIYLLLGMFLEPIGAMLITLPLFLPLINTAGYDLIWFGVLVLKLLEVGMVTPPVGLNVFVIKSVIGDQIPVATIFRGIFWFFMADLALIALCILWPDMITRFSGMQ